VKITYTKTFLKDLAKVVPAKRRMQIEKFVFEELTAFSYIENAGKIEKMTGYKDHYKIRFGDYRVGILKNGNTIEIQWV
jgi:mRNA interferase RelE/StbE